MVVFGLLMFQGDLWIDPRELHGLEIPPGRSWIRSLEKISD
jgi:hypothetical protein